LPTATMRSPSTTTAPWRMMSRVAFIVTTCDPRISVLLTSRPYAPAFPQLEPCALPHDEQPDGVTTHDGPMQMEMRRLGSSGVEVSAFALGTMMFGAWGNPDRD